MLNTQYGREIANQLQKNNEALIKNMRKNTYYPSPYGINYDDAKKGLEDVLGLQGGDMPPKYIRDFLDSYEDEVKKYSNVTMASSGPNISTYTPADLYKGFGYSAGRRRGLGYSAGRQIGSAKKEELQPFLNKEALVTGSNPFGDTVNDLGEEKMKEQIKVNKRKGKGLSAGGMSAGGMSAGGMSAGGMSAGRKRGRKPKKLEGPLLIDKAILPGQQMGDGRKNKKVEKVEVKVEVKKGKVPQHLNKWLDHVKKVKSENPTLKYKEVLVLAKKNFK